ncbi:transposase, partial [Salmonella enterica subsp. enterica serovar Typhimurium]|nr:transposase [Salmonella enterica subsp. enterica serovar Typhimurium]
MNPLINPQQIWLSTTPMDMRSGSNKLFAFILQHHPGIRPNCAYLFYNKTGTRLKVLIHDGLGI